METTANDITTIVRVDDTRRRGEILARVLGIKKARGYQDRWDTQWGTKTAVGLVATVERIMTAELSELESL